MNTHNDKDRLIYTYGEIIDKYPVQFLAFMVVIGAMAIMFTVDNWITCGIQVFTAFIASCIIPSIIKKAKRTTFPSLHTTVATSLCIITSYHLLPFIPVGIILIIATGTGRVYLNRHKWSDVFGGACIGIVISVIVIGGIN